MALQRRSRMLPPGGHSLTEYALRSLSLVVNDAQRARNKRHTHDSARVQLRPSNEALIINAFSLPASMPSTARSVSTQFERV